MLPAPRWIRSGILFGVAALSTAEGHEIERFQISLGPRVGVEYYAQADDQFSDMVRHGANLSVGAFTPVISTFAVAIEQRLRLGRSGSLFIIRETFVLGAMEQSVVLPSGRVLLGFRHPAGWEIAAGPVVGRLSLGVAVEAGHRFDLGDAELTVVASTVLPNRVAPLRIGVTTGFDFVVPYLALAPVALGLAACNLSWPPAPRNVAAEATQTGILVTWDAVPGAHGYTLAWALFEDPFTRLIEDVSSPFLHTDRPPATVHYYTVLAVSAYGTSWSGAESASTQVTSPP